MKRRRASLLTAVILVALGGVLIAAPAPSPAAAVPGDIDATFNGGSPQTADLGGQDSAYAVTVQPDGKVVLAGTSNAGGGKYNFAVTRFNADGSLDTDFGSGGSVSRAVGAGLAADVAYAVSIQADGRIVAAGTSDDGETLAFVAVRFEPDGSVDSSFGGGGVSVLATDIAPGSYAVTTSADGRIITARSVVTGDTFELLLERLSPDGSPIEASTVPFAGAAGPMALVARPDGSVVVAGSTRAGGAVDLVMIRVTPAGTVDPEFGTTGEQRYRVLLGTHRATALTAEPDGALLVAGYFGDRGANTVFVARAGQTITPPITRTLDEPYALALLADGRVVVAGAAGGDQTVARYDGALPPPVIVAPPPPDVVATPPPTPPSPEPVVIATPAPSPAPVVIVTPAPSLTQTATPRPARGDILFSDNFNDPNSGLLAKSSPDPARYQLGYLNGEYFIRESNAPLIVPISRLPGEYADASLAVDARVVGDTVQRFVVLACRTTGDTGYRLAVRPNTGSYFLARREPNRQVLLASGESTAIERGNSTNRIELSCAGGTLTITINGRQVAQVQDNTFLSGTLSIGASSEIGIRSVTEVRFDNLVVTQR